MTSDPGKIDEFDLIILITPPTVTWKPEDLDDTASVSCAGAASEFDCRAGYEVSTSGPN